MSESKIRIQRKGGFTVLPNSLLRDARLSVKAKGLACIALSLPPGWEYSVAGLAKLCGCGRDMIRGALNELEKTGYLTREQVHDGLGKFGGCRYVISDVSDIPEEPMSEPEGEPLTGFPMTDNPLTENPTQLNKDQVSNEGVPPKAPQGERRSREPKKQPDWEPERFAKFWKFYPRGENKQAAIRAWDKLKPSSELIDTMAQALKRQVASEGWRQGIGIPHASTWLNNRRWEDEVKGAAGEQVAPDRVVEEEGVHYL